MDEAVKNERKRKKKAKQIKLTNQKKSKERWRRVNGIIRRKGKEIRKANRM